MSKARRAVTDSSPRSDLSSGRSRTSARRAVPARALPAEHPDRLKRAARLVVPGVASAAVAAGAIIAVALPDGDGAAREAVPAALVTPVRSEAVSRGNDRPSPTPSRSASPTPSRTATPTPTPSRTATPTAKPKKTATPTPTATKKKRTASPKPSPTATKKKTASPEPTTAAKGSTADCPSATGGLTSHTRPVWEASCENFPYVSAYGGIRGGGGEHGQGRALDIMVSGDRGWDIAKYMRSHASELGATEVIYQQKIWTTQRSSEGWRAMEDRGSATANHYDHVHVTVG